MPYTPRVGQAGGAEEERSEKTQGVWVAFLSPPSGVAFQSVTVYGGYREEEIHYFADAEALFYLYLSVSGESLVVY